MIVIENNIGYGAKQMKELIRFNNWKIDADTPFGSGASRKNWLINNVTNQRGIFKYPKVTNGSITGEYWSECLAYEIAETLSIPCAKVDIGYFNEELGSMSYMILEDNEMLIEGISFISSKYPNYNIDTFCDNTANTWYSIQMIMKSLKDIYLDRDFLKIPIFDALIGNSDRHHSNWGVIRNNNNFSLKLSPLYDNGSSLCSIVNENKINTSDKKWLNALIDTKSKSMIRFENMRERPTHFQMVEYLAQNFYKDCIGYVYLMKNILTDDKIYILINNYPDNIIPKTMKELLTLFLITRRNRIANIFENLKG